MAVDQPAPSGRPGLAEGARIHIVEAVGDNIVDGIGHVERRDETGSTLVVKLGPFEILRLDHDFEPTPQGMKVTSHLVFGSDAPIIGRLITSLARTRFDPDAWVRHGVEEFGNLEYILPTLYQQDAADILIFDG